MNWFEQPGRYKFSAVLAALSVYLLLWSVLHHDRGGVVINAFASAVNIAAFIINYRKRDQRRQIQRQNLIRLTIGE